MKPKILHYSSSYFPRIGGIPGYIRMAARQTADVFEHHLMCRDLVRSGITTERVPAGTDDSDPCITVHRFVSDGDYLTAEMAGFVREGDFDALLIHSVHPALLEAVRLTDRPVVVFSHSCLSSYPVGERLRQAARLVVHTRAAAEHFATVHGVDGDKITVLPLLVDVETFSPDPAGSPRSRGRHHLLYAGRIAPEKRVWELPRVLRELRNRSLRYTLDVVGDYDHPVRDEPPLRKAIVENQVGGSVHFGVAHTVEGMAEAYRAADVLVSASGRETFGLVFLEALACGLPVVTTAGGGCREWASSYVYFTAGSEFDVEEVAWLVEQAEGMPAELRRRFEAEYSWQARKGDFVGIVEGVMGL